MMRVAKEKIFSLIEEDGAYQLSETMYFYCVEFEAEGTWHKIGNQYGAHKFPTLEEAERYLNKISIVIET